MNQTIKFYYSMPITKATIIRNPIINKSVISNIRQGNRYTIAVLYDYDNKEIRFGLATCLPVDNFCKATGRTLAYTNALSHPFYIISHFSGYRKDYQQEVMNIITDKEFKLMKKDNPGIFNQNMIIE